MRFTIPSTAVALLTVAALLCCPACRRKEEKPEAGSNKNSAAAKTLPSDALASAPDAARREDEAPLPDTKEFVTRLKEADPEDMEPLKRQIMMLAQTRPEEILKAIGELPPGARRDQTLRVVFENFPKEKAGLLVTWADSSGYREDRSLIGLVLPPDGTTLSREEALGLANRVKEDGVRELLLRYLAYQAAAQEKPSADSARGVAEQLPQGMRREFMNGFLYGLSHNNPANAVNEFLRNPTLYDAAAVESCFEEAGEKDPAEACGFIGPALEDPEQRKLLAPFMKGWLQRDPEAAAEWAAKLEGAPKDLAAYELAKFHLREGDHDAAKAWRNSIADVKLRESLKIP